MKTVQTLIAMARAKVHTDRELAAQLGIDPSELNAMKKGKRPPSPETVALLCDILQLPGEEAREWLAIAVIENPKNASRVEILKRALFACWALGVVAAQITITNDAEAKAVAGTATSTTDSAYQSVTHSLYIVALRVARWLARTSRLFRGRSSGAAPWGPRFAAHRCYPRAS